jgi:hypothetical protein
MMLETDGGVVRELPAWYVADHVEHAYCLTGHGMQGGTVERAFVVASPEDLTAGWSYSALSRARGATRLLICDQARHDSVRADVAPEGQRATRPRSEVLARVARRMRVRDDEDLAVNQIAAAGREDDRALASYRMVRGSRPQEIAADQAEPIEAAPSVSRLIALREQIAQLRLVLGALPTRPLARFDELDVRERGVVAERTQREERLAALEPPTRRLGRVRDPQVEKRTFLRTAIEMDDQALSEVRADRARLRRELGDPDQVRSERDGIENAIEDLRRDYGQVRADLAKRTIERRPRWLTQTLGERPGGNRDGETWDQAARDLANFRLDHDGTDQHEPLGNQPSGGDQRREWNQANGALERAQRQLDPTPTQRVRGVDLGIE